jgi:hypothetical protein
VAVEKLNHQKMAEKNFALGCPTNEFLSFLEIFYHVNFRCFDENGLFQQPQAISHKTPVRTIQEQVAGQFVF